jgi:hypothetical protein
MIQRRFLGKPKLSDNFAVNLIEKESELYRNCSVYTINELVLIYTEAIEYFSYVKDPKSEDFLEKMKKMFLRPDVIQALKLKTIQSPVKPSTMQESEQKKQESLAKVKEINEIQKDRESKRLIDYQKLRNIETAKKASNDFKLQDSDLNKRLASRRKTMLTKSMNSFRYLNTSNSSALSAVKEENDPLGNSFIKLIIEEDDEDLDINQLETIMEKYCQEKAFKSAQIQIKFENELSSIEGEGQIFDQIREQLKKDLQIELLTLSNSIESSKSLEIHQSKFRHRKNSISYS